MADWPHGYQFFEHLWDLPDALRLADMPAYIRSLGYADGEQWAGKSVPPDPGRGRALSTRHP